jgi:hypothetical protein
VESNERVHIGDKIDRHLGGEWDGESNIDGPSILRSLSDQAAAATSTGLVGARVPRKADHGLTAIWYTSHDRLAAVHGSRLQPSSSIARFSVALARWRRCTFRYSAIPKPRRIIVTGI